MAGNESASQSYEPATTVIAPAQPEPGCYAVIEYQDTGGRKTFRMTKEQIVALLSRTRGAAVTGQFELYKISQHFDGTAHNPQWLG